MPELFWLTGKWGKRFLSQALAVWRDLCRRPDGVAEEHFAWDEPFGRHA